MTQILVDALILFISSFWQTYLQGVIIAMLFNIESTNRQHFLYAAIMSIYSATAKLLLPLEMSYMNSILVLFLMIVLFTAVYSRKIFQSLLYAFVVFLISIPTEAIAGLIVFKILGYETNVENVVGTIPVLLMINIWFTIVAAVIYLLKNKDKLTIMSNDNIVTQKSLYINIFLVVLIILPNALFYTTNQYNYPFLLLLFNIIMNILLVVLSVYNTYKNVQLEKKKHELKLAEQHNKTLNALLDSIRAFKHDYSNMVHSLGGYITFGDMEGLAKFYEGLTRETKKAGQLESISPTKITEPSVYTLFATKHEDARAKDILFSVETMFDYKKLNMPIFDFCKILGIFLDNAIEAAEESDEREINIVFRRSAADKVQIFSIENTYKDKDVDTENIFEKDFSTKNRNSGIGLWEVKNIVDRNKNVTLLTSKDKKFFTQRLIISEEILEENIPN